MEISDGTGTSQKAQVKNNKLLISGVMSSQEHFANHSEGLGFNMIFSATPSAAGNCFLYLKNTHQTLNLSVEGIWIKMEADDYFEVKLGDAGTPVGGSGVVPANCNSSSGEVAQGSFLSGADITGLSGGTTTHKIYHATSKESIYRNFNMDIIIGSNGVLSMYIGTGTVAIEGMIVFNFHGINN